MFLIKVVLVICICLTKLTLQESVKVSLYYEALCPYSQSFVTKQLYPGYQVLGDSITLELVPFGKAKERVNKKGKRTFTCQHGPKECHGNKLQACVLGQNVTEAEGIKFVACIMATENPENNTSARRCLDQTKLSWKTVKNCANGEEGADLLSFYGNETANLTPKLEHVPYIIFNDVYSEDRDNMARDNFLDTVCELFHKKPTGCNN